MATAPVVQSLDQIMAELQPGYEAQRGVINKQIDNTAATYAAQKTALDAQKTQGFNQINTQATGKGMTFSGIPLDEQANYLSTTYLPGVQAADAKRNEDTLTLQGQLAAIDTDIRNRAQGTRDQQQSALNQWNLQQQQLEAKAREAAVDRAAKAALARSSGGSSKGTSLYDVLFSEMAKSAGKDGKVSPTKWRTMVAYAKNQGMSFGGKDGFASTFWNFANDKYWKEYKLGYDAYM